jgi:hypothetical protein
MVWRETPMLAAIAATVNACNRCASRQGGQPCQLVGVHGASDGRETWPRQPRLAAIIPCEQPPRTLALSAAVGGGGGVARYRAAGSGPATWSRSLWAPVFGPWSWCGGVRCRQTGEKRRLPRATLVKVGNLDGCHHDRSHQGAIVQTCGYSWALHRS